MKRLIILFLLATCCNAFAEQPSWNPTDAARDAERDIRRGKIRFYWHGTVGVMSPGVPLSIAERYPHGDAGTSCNVDDFALFDRKGEYALRYNVRMLAYVQSKR